MPNTKGNNRRGVVLQEPEKNRRGKLQEKSMSYHGRSTIPAPAELRRPKTLPNMYSGRTLAAESPSAAASTPRLTKLLLNVTFQGSLGAVQVVISPDSTVCDLISAAIRQYVKECRRPLLPSSDASNFDLHYSQFSLESLRRDEKLITLGSRSFFLCQKKKTLPDLSSGKIGERTPSCAKESEKEGEKKGFNWLKFMPFLN